MATSLLEGGRVAVREVVGAAYMSIFNAEPPSFLDSTEMLLAMWQFLGEDRKRTVLGELQTGARVDDDPFVEAVIAVQGIDEDVHVALAELLGDSQVDELLAISPCVATFVL